MINTRIEEARESFRATIVSELKSVVLQDGENGKMCLLCHLDRGDDVYGMFIDENGELQVVSGGGVMHEENYTLDELLEIVDAI